MAQDVMNIRPSPDRRITIIIHAPHKMSLRNVASCNNCRRWVLRTFITSIGGSALQVPRRAFTTPAVTPPKSPEEDDSLSSITSETHRDSLRTLPSDPSEYNNIEPSSTTAHPDQTPPSITSQLPPTSIPWYLQPQTTLPSTTPASISARQRLPELPSHSPALLQPLLEHLSTTLGLDDLSLLDLRPMDPPPALGANLLMVLGTTRSERHLHVSADRLCRWLRTEHALAPYADGLLGRNELKLKMRRLAKKKNLLSAVGGGGGGYDARNDPEGEAVDDGIRTGWVCVNIGTVAGGEVPKTAEQLAREAGIVGFNTQGGGCKIVVQMMTEERRESLGLERLWMGILQRNVKERNEVLLGLEGEEAEEEQVPEVVRITKKREEKQHQQHQPQAIVEAEAHSPPARPAPETPSQQSDTSAQPTTLYTPFNPGQYVGRGKKDRRFQVERV